MLSHPLSPLHPPHPCLLSLVPPPTTPSPPTTSQNKSPALARLQGCSPYGDGWSVSYDKSSVISWWIRAVGNPFQSVWVGRWPAAAPSLPGPSEPLRQGHRDRGRDGGGGGGNGLALTCGSPRTHCELDCWRRHKTFGCDLNSDGSWTLFKIGQVFND